MLTAYTPTIEGIGRRTDAGLDLTFRWRLRSTADGINQKSYSITVSDAQGDAWTSGWRDGDSVSHRELVPLRAGRRYSFTIEIEDDGGNRGEPCGAEFLTGPEVDAWNAAWIGRDPEPATAKGEPKVPTDLGRTWQTMYSQPPLQLRRRFDTAEAPDSAVLHITARGVYRPFVNGRRVGDEELAPGWTNYSQRIEVASHDVTDLVEVGGNVLAVEVADGWWSGYVGFDTRHHARLYGDAPQLSCILELTFADGSVERIDTNSGWTECPGQIVMADLLMGEYHDLAMETFGWMETGFDDSDWRAAAVLDRDASVLVVADGPPVRALEVLSATHVHSAGAAHVVDFGQNLVGRVRLRLRNQPKGTVVRIRHGEMLDGGALYTANLRTAEALDIVALADQTEVEFEPRHTVHGFRYVEIEGAVGDIAPGDVEAVVIGTDLPRTGWFTSSSALVNQLYSNIRWGQKGNFVAVPTDCPQRDERLGWTADTQIFAPTALFNSASAGFLRRWLEDLRLNQRDDGSVPDVVPLPPHSTNFQWGAPAWGDAAILVPWSIYRTSGDVSVLSESLASMHRWNDYVAERTSRGVWDRGLGNNYGDWLSVDAVTPHALVATAYYAHTSAIAAEVAAIVGDRDGERKFRARATEAVEAFQRTFLDARGGLMDATQTGCAMALSWNLVENGQRQVVCEQLVEDIESRGGRLTTGFLGVALLCPILSEIGRADLAYELLLQEEYPSWGYSIRHGATTIWERWDGWTEDNGFQSVTMNSFNHYSLGSVGEWLYRGVAGIDQAVTDAGFRELVIRPHLTERLQHAAAEFQAPRGLVRSSWHRLSSGAVAVSVEVPPGSTARVVLEDDVHKVGSGTFEFVVVPAGMRVQS